MFNPKQALQRIRKNKNNQQQQSDNAIILNQHMMNRPLFPESNNNSNNLYKVSNQNNLKKLNKNAQGITTPNNIQNRMVRLQQLVADLSKQLSNSNQTIQYLKKQKSDLQTHILKLQHQNNQLKSSQIKNISDSKHYKTNNRRSQTQNNHSEQKIIKKSQIKQVQQQVLSPEVQEMLQQIKKEPILNILKRKQHNFRALKNVSKDSLIKGQKIIKQLSNIQKNYAKNYKKPTLIINLEDLDFQ